MSSPNTSSALLGRFSQVVTNYAGFSASAGDGGSTKRVTQPTSRSKKDPRTKQILAKVANAAAQLDAPPTNTQVTVVQAPRPKSKWTFSIDYDAYNRPVRIHATPVVDPLPVN